MSHVRWGSLVYSDKSVKNRTVVLRDIDLDDVEKNVKSVLQDSAKALDLPCAVVDQLRKKQLVDVLTCMDRRQRESVIVRQ